MVYEEIIQDAQGQDIKVVIFISHKRETYWYN